MKGSSMEDNVEDVMQLCQDLILAEAETADEIKANQRYMDGIQLKLNYAYQPGLYSYKGGWLSWHHYHIQRLEGILLDVYGYKYHRQGKAKWLHSVLDARISSLYKQMHHCNNIAKEKQLLKDIRQTEEDKRKCTVNAAMEKLKLPKYLSSVDQIQDSIEESYARIDALKSEERSARGKRKDLRKGLESLNKDISHLTMKLEDIRMKKQAAKKLLNLQKQSENAAVNMKKHA